LSIAAAIFALILGIVALVLYLTGHMTFKEPCVAVSHFQIQQLTMESADTSTNPLMNILDTFTGGLASQAIPAEANLRMELTMEVNNTNTFGLGYQQAELGQVYIPAFLLDGVAGDAPISLEEDPNDFFVGEWELPKGKLEGKARNEIPVSFEGAIDLANPLTALNVAPILLEGGAFAFLTTGSIKGTSWVPGVSGEIQLTCLATFDNILNFGQDAKVNCRQSLTVESFIGEIYNAEGELDVRRLQSIFEQPADPACYV